MLMGPTRSPHDSMHNIRLSAAPISAIMYPLHQGQSRIIEGAQYL